MPLVIQNTGCSPSLLGHIGTVGDVIAAHLPAELTSRIYQADDFLAGFELATPKHLNSLGEAVLINGFCYANSTDQTSQDYDKTISGKTFHSGGFFLIPKEAKPSHLFEVSGGIAMSDFYQEAYQTIQHPWTFFGIFHFSAFHGTAIGKAPIDGRNIFAHKSEYYPNPDVFRNNVWGFVMGAAADFTSSTKVNKELESVLYVNPMDAKSDLVHHAHVLLLKKRVDHYGEIIPELTDRVLHVFIDGTFISQGHGKIFTVGAVQDYLLRGRKTA